MRTGEHEASLRTRTALRRTNTGIPELPDVALAAIRRTGDGADLSLPPATPPPPDGTLYTAQSRAFVRALRRSREMAAAAPAGGLPPLTVLCVASPASLVAVAS